MLPQFLSHCSSFVFVCCCGGSLFLLSGGDLESKTSDSMAMHQSPASEPWLGPWVGTITMFGLLGSLDLDAQGKSPKTQASDIEDAASCCAAIDSFA